MLHELQADIFHEYRAFRFSFEVESRCYLIDAIEDPLPAVLQEIELCCQSGEIHPSGRPSGNQLNPGFIPILKLDAAALYDQDPCTVGCIVDCEGVEHTALRGGKPVDTRLRQLFRQSNDREIEIRMFLNCDTSLLQHRLALRQCGVLGFP